MRLRILERATEPASAAEIGRAMDEKPQKVNYHVKLLADAGFLRPAGERRRGNLIERRYRATARRYVFSPSVLGEMGLAAAPVDAADAFSAARLLGLTALVQQELGEAMREAAEMAGAVPTLSVDAEVVLRSAADRARFARELQGALLEVITRYAEPHEGPVAAPAAAYRIVLGGYPLPRGGRRADVESTEEGDR